MDVKHLQALVGIADTGSFSAAAEALGTVQSNVSAHVARLERELAVVLVDRASGRLTEEGEIVVVRARRVMAELDAMVSDVVAQGQDVVGVVRIGVIGTTGRWLVPLLFSALRRQHPSVTLQVADGTSTTLEPQLLSHLLDLAVVSLPVPGDELSATPLFEEDLVLVVPTGHRLDVERPHTAAAPGPGAPPSALGPSALGPSAPVPSALGPSDLLPLETLAEIELLLPAPGTALRDEIDEAVEPSGVVLRPSMELDGIRLIASLTFDGYGPAILPASAVPAHLRAQFRLLRIEGLPRRAVGVAVRRRGHPSAPVRAVIDTLYDVVQDPGAPEGLSRFPRRPPGTVTA